MLSNPALATLQRFAAQHPDIASAGRIGLAFSGGADSTALLLAARSFWDRQRLIALHVNHGLQPSAPAFAAHCARFCAAQQLPCAEAQVSVDVGRGQSVEEQARDARYLALAELARQQGCTVVLLAQHGDDQAESVLLALLRGAGPRGLAAMPARMLRHGVLFARPLLDCGSAELRAWLTAQGVAFLRDPMNVDPAFRRSRIRAELLPVIAQLEPAYRQTLGRTAALCAAADAQVQWRASDDLRRCAVPDGLDLAALRSLGAERLSEALRLWLRLRGQRLDRARTDELVRQVLRSAQGAHHLELQLPLGVVRRQGRLLVFHPRDPARPRT
ncbi:MAG: tRNA lysidine(34) synthetase TilS [Thiomonas sp.]